MALGQRIHRVHGQRVVESATGNRKVLDVVADRFRIGNVEKARALEAIEASPSAAAAASACMW
jgi:excinuclease UvrABC ATPase subunit